MPAIVTVKPGQIGGAAWPGLACCDHWRYYVSCPALDLNLIKGFHRICNKTFLILRNLNLLLDFLGRLFVIIIYNDIFAPEFKKVEDIY
jgi:hypothetical protein